MKNTTRSKTFKSGFLPFLAPLFIMALAGCFSPMGEEDGTVSVTIGGGGGARSAWLADASGLDHTITVSSGGEEQKREGVKSGQTALFTVMTGNLSIKVEGFDGSDLKAEGTLTAEAVRGKNVAVNVRMDPVLPSGADNVYLQNLINGAQDGATLRLSGTITMNDTVTIDKKITLTTRPGVDAKLERGTTPTIFSGPLIEVLYGSLTLEGSGNGTITLDGMNIPGSSVISPLIKINDGNVTMNHGATLTNNESWATTSNGVSGGGVYVGSGGIFTMNGGTISRNDEDNTYSYGGGGVYVASNGTFYMNGGTISGNTAAGSGGGVYVASSGTFYINGGTISGNAGNEGGGVFVGGTFNLNSPATPANISGNTSNTAGSSPQVHVGGNPPGTFNVNGVQASGY